MAEARCSDVTGAGRKRAGRVRGEQSEPKAVCSRTAQHRTALGWACAPLLAINGRDSQPSQKQQYTAGEDVLLK